MSDKEEKTQDEAIFAHVPWSKTYMADKVMAKIQESSKHIKHLTSKTQGLVRDCKWLHQIVGIDTKDYTTIANTLDLVSFLVHKYPPGDSYECLYLLRCIYHILGWLEPDDEESQNYLFTYRQQIQQILLVVVHIKHSLHFLSDEKFSGPIADSVRLRKCYQVSLKMEKRINRIMEFVV